MKPTVVGLTGSIGMGKSTTAELFKEAGVPVWGADEVVHRLYSRDSPAVPLVASIAPVAVVDGEVDRGILAAWVQQDVANLTKLENAIHPLVVADREHFVSSSVEDVVVLDIPLLFETGADETVDVVVVVSAPADEQRRRVLARPGMTEEKLRFILSKQLPDAEKRRRADFVIETRSLEVAQDAVQNVLKEVRLSRTDA